MKNIAVKGARNMSIMEISKKHGRPSKKPDNEQLFTEYSQMTATQLAEKYGVPVSTVRSWIARARKKNKEEMRNARQ
jgi:uncharacterized protein YjcR